MKNPVEYWAHWPRMWSQKKREWVTGKAVRLVPLIGPWAIVRENGPFGYSSSRRIFELQVGRWHITVVDYGPRAVSVNDRKTLDHPFRWISGAVSFGLPRRVNVSVSFWRE